MDIIRIRDKETREILAIIDGDKIEETEALKKKQNKRKKDKEERTDEEE